MPVLRDKYTFMQINWTIANFLFIVQALLQCRDLYQRNFGANTQRMDRYNLDGSNHSRHYVVPKLEVDKLISKAAVDSTDSIDRLAAANPAGKHVSQTCKNSTEPGLQNLVDLDCAVSDNGPAIETLSTKNNIMSVSVPSSQPTSR